MDINFKCPHCAQDLSVDESNAGSETACPACNGHIVIPALTAATAAPPAGGNLNPIASSAAAREHKHFVVPQHDKKEAENLIAKPQKPLEAAAKDGIHIRVKTFRHSDHIEVGKDHFDEHLTKFLNEVGEANIVKLETVIYTHQDLASRQWITDYGVMVVYHG